MQKILLPIFLCAIVAYSAVNFPYPQNRNYGNSTINTTSSTTNLKTRFSSFLSRLYEEGTCNNKFKGPCARIKFDTESQTVSEGIGYGMIIMVYFSDNTTSYQSQFDKLWAYYQNWTNGNGLMNWKINGFSSVVESGGATDAEFDVALALVMAHYQFGSTSSKNYLDTAKALISKIRAYEISSNNLHKPGDAWDSERNPSYVSPAAFEIFKEVESSQSAKWQSVITANYTLLKNNQNSSSGLFSDWCNDNGGVTRGKYGYDAARVPWRIAWANAWYGHADAKTLLTNLYTKFLSSKNASDIKGAIEINGNISGNDKNSTFVGPFTNALSYSSQNQTKMNDYWGTLIGFTNEPYYSATLQLLTGLLASGNMPNLKALQPGSGGGSSSSSGGGSASSGVLIDNFAGSAEDRVFAKTWEPWYAYTDVGNSGSSTMQNTKSTAIGWDKDKNSCQEMVSYTVIMQDGSDWVAKIDRYSLSQGGNKDEPYVALGLQAENNGLTTTGGYNFSGCTGGFTYSYKGEAHNFKAQLKTVKDYAYHSMEVAPASNSAWKDVSVPISELRQPSAWGDKVDFKLSDINAFSWELKGGKSGSAGLSANTGSLAIKNFRCIGTMTFPTAKPAAKCGGSSSSKANSSSSVSSSSKANSSSSVSSSSRGSSSSVSSSSSSIGSSSSSVGISGSSSSIEGGSSSSDEGGDTPIISVSPYAANSGAFAIKNGVNLRVAQKASMEVFNLNGKSVRKMDLLRGNYYISLGDLPKGLYVVSVKSDNRREILRIPVK